MDVVSAIQQRIAARIGEARFALWFGSSVRLELTSEAIVVSAGDPFTLERVRRQFARELQQAIVELHAERSDVPRQVDYRVHELLASAQTTAAPATLASGGTLTPTAPPAPTTSAPTRSQPHRMGTTPVQSAATGESPTRRRFARFESFVIGETNRLAATAAQSVAARPGTVCPLVLYGPSGCGKTHLLEAIWSASRQHSRTNRSLFLSAEQFTTYFLEALQGSGLPSFRRKVRDVDLLVIDDIQFLAGKRATIVEFQHTLDSLLRQGRQLVVSADRAPADLTGLGAEVMARLSGGLACGVEPADFATRCAITQQFAARLEMILPPETLELIATEASGDARQIRGALHRLQAAAMALGRSVTVEEARNTLADLLAAGKRHIRLPDIERAVCDVFGLEPNSLREGGKARNASQPRMLAMWLARKYTRLAFSEISEFFGRRSHTTVISAEQKVNEWRADGTQLRLGGNHWSAEEAIRRVESRLRTG